MSKDVLSESVYKKIEKNGEREKGETSMKKNFHLAESMIEMKNVRMKNDSCKMILHSS